MTKVEYSHRFWEVSFNYQYITFHRNIVLLVFLVNRLSTVLCKEQVKVKTCCPFLERVVLHKTTIWWKKTLRKAETKQNITTAGKYIQHTEPISQKLPLHNLFCEGLGYKNVHTYCSVLTMCVGRHPNSI